MTKPNAAENTFQMQESCEKSTKLGGFFWKRGKVSSGMERPSSKGEDSTERTETGLSTPYSSYFSSSSPCFDLSSPFVYQSMLAS